MLFVSVAFMIGALATEHLQPDRVDRAFADQLSDIRAMDRRKASDQIN
jgi:hypothetical protein